MTNIETKQQFMPVDPKSVFVVEGMGVYALGRGEEFEGKVFAYECTAGKTLEEANDSIVGRKLSEQVLQCDPTAPETNYVTGLDISYDRKWKIRYPSASLGMWRELRGVGVPKNV